MVNLPPPITFVTPGYGALDQANEGQANPLPAQIENPPPLPPVPVPIQQILPVQIQPTQVIAMSMKPIPLTSHHLANAQTLSTWIASLRTAKGGAIWNAETYETWIKKEMHHALYSSSGRARQETTTVEDYVYWIEFHLPQKVKQLQRYAEQNYSIDGIKQWVTSNVPMLVIKGHQVPAGQITE